MDESELNKKIRKIILENPDLPIKFMVKDGVNNGDYNYIVGEPSSAEIEEVAEWEDILYTKDDFADAVYSSMELDYKNKSDEEFNKAVNEVVNNTKFEKIISILIS